MKHVVLSGYWKEEAYLQMVLNEKRMLKDLYTYQITDLPGGRKHARKLEPFLKNVSSQEAMEEADEVLKLASLTGKQGENQADCFLFFGKEWLPDVLETLTEFSQAGYPFYLFSEDEDLDPVLSLTRYRKEEVPFKICLVFKEGEPYTKELGRTILFKKAAEYVPLSLYSRILMSRFSEENWKKNYFFLTESKEEKRIYLTVSKQSRGLKEEEYQVLKAMEEENAFGFIGVKRETLETVAAMCMYEYLENERIEALLRTGFARIENYDDVIVSFLGSRRCNLKCSYCFSDHRCEKLSSMSSADMLRMMDLLVGEREDVNLHLDNNLGGEPLEDFDAVKTRHNVLASYGKNSGKESTFGLLMNGTKLEKEHLPWIKSHIPYVGVSLDGDKETHDKIRKDALGQPTYDRAVRGIRLIQEEDWPSEPGVSMVLSKNNMDVTALLKHVREELNVKNIVMKPVRASWSSDFALTDTCMEELKTQYKRLFTYLLSEGEKGRLETFYTMLQPLDYAGRFLLRTYYKDRFIVKRCGSGEHIFSVNDDGKVYPCDSFNGVDGYEIADLERGFHNECGYEVPMVMDEDAAFSCGTCPHRYLCGGICTYVKHLNHYRHNEVTKMECEFARFLITEAILFWERAKKSWKQEVLNEVDDHIKMIGFKKAEKSPFFYAPC